MTAIGKINDILSQVPAIVAEVNKDRVAYGAAVVARKGAIDSETARFNGALDDLQKQHDSNVAEIEAAFKAATDGLPADPTEAEKEYADFLTSLHDVVGKLPASLDEVPALVVAQPTKEVASDPQPTEPTSAPTATPPAPELIA